MSGYKRLKYVFLLLFCVLGLTGCSMEELGGYLEFLGLYEEESMEQIGIITLQEMDGAAENKEWIPVEVHRISYENAGHDTYAYDSLTDAEKLWYQDINELLAYRSDEGMELSKAGLEAGLTDEAVDKVYQCVLIDHPEYFYVDGYEYTKYSIGDKLLGVKIRGSYTLEPQECSYRKAEIDAAVEEILKQAPLDGTDYEKIKFVYEYIILNTKYDVDSADNQNIYSVLVGKASVCQGYAKATQYLLNCLGVDCTLVFGEVDEGEAHSWNMVKSDEEYYYLDTTWGDPSYTQNGELLESGDAPEIKYDYLCITTNQLSLTHEIKHEIELPQCNTSKDNYYIREGCYFLYYDEDQLRREFEESFQAEQGMVALKCDSREVYNTMYEELITNQRIFEFLEDTQTSVAYIQEAEQLTLTFWVTK